MKRKILVGLIAIVAVAIFVGCIEKDQVSTPTATPSPKITPKPTPTTTPSPTITPTPTEKSGPDLIVEDIKAIAIRKPSLPSELPSYITSVTFTVKNVGDKPVTEKFYTKILAETYNFHLMYPAKYITVQIDSSDAIAELNEKNNQKEVETPESEPETIKSIKIGKSVTLDGIEYTVNNVRVIDPKGIGEIVGNLVVVNYGIYPGEKPIKGFPPTGVTPGLPCTGNVFFEVPKDSEKLKLKVGSHRWKCNYAIIDIEASKIIEENIEEWTKD